MKALEFLQWFHVIEPGKNEGEAATVWGFAANDEDIILKAPPLHRWMEGETLQDVKYYFIDSKSTVVKVNPLAVKI